MNSYIIFGANSDIARELINQLSNNNKIYAIARKFNNVYNHPNIEMINSEFSDFIQVESLIKNIVEKDPNIIGVANFAGTIFIKPAHLTSETDYQNVLDSNFKTTFAITRGVGKHLSNTSVVFISTTASLIGLASHELVAASKAAVNGLVISASASYAHKNIRFNAIAPALIDTKLASSLLINDASRKMSESINPLNKIGQAKDIANLAYFLLNPDNNWITGQIYAVDGGMSTVKPRMKA